MSETPAPEKLSAALRFRVAPSFAARVDALASLTKVDESTILRTGLELCWPQIEAHILQTSLRGSSVSADDVHALAEAKRLGLDVPTILKRAIQTATPAA